MRGARASVLGSCLLAATLALAAAEDAAPLEATKQALRQLEGAQKSQAAEATTGRVKLNAPALDIRSTDDQALRSWSEGLKKEERQRQEQKQRNASNWLVNGVEQLGKEGTASPEGGAVQPANVGEERELGTPLDPSDPQYLLKLFDEQKKQADAKESAAKPRSAPAPDPFAPFLQGWLGDSPVRDQVMEQFKKGSEAGILAGGSGGDTMDFRSPAAGSSPGANPVRRDLSEPAKPNPYLVELNAPIPQPDVLAGGSPVVVDRALTSGIPATTAPLTTPLLDVLPVDRAPAKGPPGGQADDKKYFPQQKKF